MHWGSGSAHLIVLARLVLDLLVRVSQHARIGIVLRQNAADRAHRVLVLVVEQLCAARSLGGHIEGVHLRVAQFRWILG